MVNSVSASNHYGSIQRFSVTPDNRVIYRVIDSGGKDAGMFSVAQNDVDTFEKAYTDIMRTAPKIQEYVAKNSKPEDLQRRRTLSRIITGTGGFIGGAAPLLFSKKAGTSKKIVSSIFGILAGLMAGFASALAVTTPPGAFKFAKATRNLSQIDIQKIEDAPVVTATRM